ncbi:MAG TPA: hypothetical protein EYQ31_04345 [Candidatus Handelsmanbacteria bacterium]|nr:hypothetical protein [Candidatus Handelsmanbacteria bacterium]
MLKWMIWGVVLSMLVACGSGERTLNEADPNIVAQRPAYAQVEPIFQRDCIPCHSGTDDGPREEDDGGEDDKRAGRRIVALVAIANDPGLESCQSIVNNLEDVVEEIFDNNSMPPGAWPRLTSKERLTIERWIDGGASCD